MANGEAIGLIETKGLVAAVEAWANSHRDQVDRVDTLIGDLERSGAFTVARLTLAASQIRDLLDA